MNANETREAMVGAYLLPTIGLTPLVISLFARFRYALEVVEILSRSGIRVFWNFIGKSANSETKSVSSSRSNQLVSFLGFVLFIICFFVLLSSSSEVWVFLANVWVVRLGLVVLFLGELGLVRSEIFLVESFVEFNVFDEEVEFSFLILEVEFNFLSSSLVLAPSESDDNKVDDFVVFVVLVELVLVVILVWFLVEIRSEVLASLVWFLDERVGLRSLVWFFKERVVLEILFLGFTIG